MSVEPKGMSLDDFDYSLPPGRIAQVPPEHREDARLLTLDRSSGAIGHHGFGQIVEQLRPRDLLVLNDTRVRPARLRGRKASGGQVELLLIETVTDGDRSSRWLALLQVSRPPAIDSRITLADGTTARVVERSPDGWLLEFSADRAAIEGLMERDGAMPLPPYIHRDENDPRGVLDRERYQTVFADQVGAVAAPTAGLHFSDALLERIVSSGVSTATITLHVGPGTFLPVRVDDIDEHRMHEEVCEISPATSDAVARARRDGGRVVAVGTTVVRTLEHAATEGRRVRPGRGSTDLFIRPGFEFRVVDAMITNFHLPRSTLLMLVCAFAGRDSVLQAYRDAVEREYRFFSYGDAMWIE